LKSDKHSSNDNHTSTFKRVVNVSNTGHTGKLFVGIDGGGTKCKARLESEDGSLLAEATTGPANAARDLDASIANIIKACELCLKKADLPTSKLAKLNVGMGLAGINIPSVKQAFEARDFPFANTLVTTDLHIACVGAHKGQDGSVVIVGTGSSGIAVTKNKQISLGGHGFLVGDKGSGAWIGRMAVEHCLETQDGIIEANALAEAVMTALDCKNVTELASKTVCAPPAYFAQLSPTIFKLAIDHQVDALNIIGQAAQYIDKLSKQLLKQSPAKLSFIGGVSQALLPYLSKGVQGKVTPAAMAPECGAIILMKEYLYI
jgi:glucosamine kinase